MMQWLLRFLFLIYSSSFFHMPPIVESAICKHEISSLLHFKDGVEVNCTPPYNNRNDPLLIVFGYDTSLGYPKTSTWDNAESLLNGTAKWDGVECDLVSGHVIRLDLSSSCLVASYINSSSISTLVHLEHLNLAFNRFYSIPSELGNLSRLSYLNLSNSGVWGQVPLEISKLSMLTSLDLSDNGLTVDFESLVHNMTNLEVLDLSFVNPISSELPKSLFANMFSLRSFTLDRCTIYGEFPQGIFHLPKLQHLSIKGNFWLNGHLPADFNSSTTPLLESLMLSKTNFSGTIPVSFGNFLRLRELDLSTWQEWRSILGKISGSIPASLGNLTQLTSLDLSDFHTIYSNNNFTTMSSSWIGKLTNLKHLVFSRANLTGEISHSSLANTTDLTLLDLSQNRLTGQIPSVLTKWTQLYSLTLHDNQLTSEIPLGFVNLTKLKYLDVSYNKLNDTLELDSFLELTNLTTLLLSSNNLTLLPQQRNMNINSRLPSFFTLGLSSCRLSKLPEFLMHQPELRFLDLSYNNIEGPIPKWMGNTKFLVSANLSHNYITSLFDDPRLFLRWPRLFTLDVSYNKLQGSLSIPSPLLETYIASNNELTGKIPRLLCKWTSIELVDFSNNRLTGNLDPHCSRGILHLLNVRNNSFYGKIPAFCTNIETNSDIRMIDLNSNQFQGKIPRSLENCTNLEFLDVGSNFVKG